MQLSTIDTNLLMTLHPLLQTCSVNQAAQELGLSPSATSHALARLRVLFDDPLLVRAGRCLVLTPRGAALTPLVARAVYALRKVIQPAEDFRPEHLKRTFHLLHTDSQDWVVLPAFDKTLQALAPRVNLHSHGVTQDLIGSLRNGSIDVAILLNIELPPDMHTRTFMHDRFVSIVRRGHPCLQQPLTLASYADLQHILVAPGGTPGGVVDVLLAQHGLKRRVVRTFSSFLPAPFLVAQSDYILTLPQSVARVAATFLEFEQVEVPLMPPDYALHLVWHQRLQHDPAHRWFRGLLAEHGAQLCVHNTP